MASTKARLLKHDFPVHGFSGKFGGNFPGIFLTHRTKAQKIRGKFRSIFRKKIRGSKQFFRAKFTLQTCHLKKMASAKVASAIDVRIDDVGSILKFRIGFPFGEILKFRIGSVSSIGGLIAATLFAATVSDSQRRGRLVELLGGNLQERAMGVGLTRAALAHELV